MPQESLRVKYYRHKETVLIRAVGPIVRSNSTNLIRPVLALVKKGITSLVLDLTYVPFIDASGVETLQEANDLLAALEQLPLRVVIKPGSRVDNALRTAAVRENFRVYDSVDRAWSDTESGPGPAESSGGLSETSEEMYLSLARQEHGDVVVYSLEGELDIEEIRQLKEVLLGELSAGNTKIVLEMYLVRFVDSSALGLFARIGRHLRDAGGDLRFARLSEQTQRVFSVFRLEQVYRCYKTVAGAVESYKLA
jgi:anti-sigma B factor antagonist